MSTDLWHTRICLLALAVAFCSPLPLSAQKTFTKERFPWTLRTDRYQEVLIQQEPVERHHPDWSPEAEKEIKKQGWKDYPAFFLRGRAGVGAVEGIRDGYAFGAYGADLAIPLYRLFGVSASTSVSHFSGGHQWMNTIGVYKVGVVSDDFTHRIGYSVLYDHISDTQFAGYHLTQMRYSLHYVFNDQFAMGIQYSEPRTPETAVAPGLFGVAQLNTSELFELFWTLDRRTTQYTLGIRYQDDHDYWGIRGLIRHRVSDCVALFAQGIWDQNDRWGTLAGLELTLGPNGRERYCDSACETGLANASSRLMERNAILRGEEELSSEYYSSAEDSTFYEGETVSSAIVGPGTIHTPYPDYDDGFNRRDPFLNLFFGRSDKSYLSPFDAKGFAPVYQMMPAELDLVIRPI